VPLISYENPAELRDCSLSKSGGMESTPVHGTPTGDIEPEDNDV